MTAQRGSVSIVVIGLAMLALVFALFTVDVVLFVAGRAQAQVAADSAALAAAPATFAGQAAGTAAAAAAAANGGRLTRCECPHDATWALRWVVVTVEIPIDLTLLRDTTAQATAKAVFDPTRLRG